MHRYHPAKKQVIKTTGETDKEKALIKAIQIVNDARVALSVEGLRGVIKRDFSRDARVKADAQSAKEEEILLGNKLDEVNPRLDTLWTFSEEHNSYDTGVLADFYRKAPSQNIFLSKRVPFRALFTHLKSIGVNRIKDVTTQHLSDYYALVMPKYKRNTIQFLDISIRNMYNFLRKEYGISITYPALAFEPKPIFTVVTDASILNDDEIKKLSTFLEAYPNPTPYQMFMLCLHCGLRKSEASNLLWSNVSFSTNKLTITSNSDDSENGVRKSTLKTRHSFRVVPIKKSFLPLLQSWHDNRDASNPYVVYINGDRMRYHNKALDKKLKALCSKWHLHILRHTFISSALIKGKVNPVEVAKWVGDSVDMILNTYSHYIDTGNIDNW